jgi:hypothetical protein
LTDSLKFVLIGEVFSKYRILKKALASNPVRVQAKGEEDESQDQRKTYL